MPLAGIAFAPLLVSSVAPPPRRSSFATAARRPRALRRARCSATATASGEAGDTGGLSRATLLWRAAKLPIYSVALVPLTVSRCNSQPLIWCCYTVDNCECTVKCEPDHKFTNQSCNMLSMLLIRYCSAILSAGRERLCLSSCRPILCQTLLSSLGSRGPCDHLA
jgi:hypothetical protein